MIDLHKFFLTFHVCESFMTDCLYRKVSVTKLGEIDNVIKMSKL